MRKYSDYLPEYLDGSNITAHSSILEKQDKIVDDKLDLLALWNVLDRPILIERVQSEAGVCTVNVHVNTAAPIKSIMIGSTVEESYDEDDLITSTIVTKEYTDTVPPVLPSLLVTVETYDDRTYVKGYPENDEAKGNRYDHDEFLDLYGKIIGIPRRTYKDLGTLSTQYYFPPFFSKRGIQDTGICTEDDYYYSQRLQKFINGIDRKDFVVHIAEVLYEWNNSRIIHCENRTTYLYNSLRALVGRNRTYDLVTTQTTYWNMDYSNMQEILSNYYPITRLIFPIPEQEMHWYSADAYYKDATQTLTFTGIVYSNDGGYLSNSVFDVVYYDMMKKESASETVIKPTAYDSDWVDCTHLITYNDIFASILLRDQYELTVFVDEDYGYIKEYLFNVLTDYGFSSLDDIIELIGETSLVQKPFNLSNWYCTYDEEDGEANGLLDGGLYFGKLCNNFTPSLPDSDWLVCMEFYTNDYFEKYGDTVEIAYLNTVDGSIVLKVEASNGDTQWGTDWNVTIDEYTGSTLTGSTSVDDINLVHGSLVLERSGNRISFAYIGTTGNRVLYQRDYSSLSVCGCLYVRNSATWKTRLNKHYRYRIGEYNSDKTDLPVYNSTNWSMISRGDGSTNPVFNDDGTISCGKYTYHIWKQAINPDKVYTMYIYKSTIYGYMNAGIGNSNTEIPSMYSSLMLNASSGAIAGVNKVTIYYDTTEQKWCMILNDNSSTVIVLMNNTNPRYLLVSTQVTTSEVQRILSITEENNGGGAIMDKYIITKQADNDSHYFTHDTFTEEASGKPTTNADGSLKVGTGYITDWFLYNNDENWIIMTTLHINTFSTSEMGLATDSVGDGHNWGVWNIHGKWIDFNDNTSSGSTRILLNEVTYGEDSTLQVRISRNGNIVTWQITDDNGNTQTIPLTNITQTRNTRWYMRCHGETTDIDLLDYMRLTKIEEMEE